MSNDLDGFVPYKKGTRGRFGKNELTGKSGCYAVITKDNGKVYVGSTDDLARRASENLSTLKYNKHRNKNLQEAYNKNPNVEILVQPTNTTEEARQLEQETVNKFLPTGRLHNIGTDDVTRPTLGITMREETRKKLSDANLGKVLSVEHKQKLLDANRGRKMSEETRLAVSKAHLGKVVSDETKQKMSTGQKERFTTDEGKANLARRMDKLKQPIIGDGVIYPSMSEAAKALGVSVVTIAKRCENNNFPGYFKVDKTT